MPDPNVNANGNYISQQIGSRIDPCKNGVCIETRTTVNDRPGPEANRERREEGDEQRASGDLLGFVLNSS